MPIKTSMVVITELTRVKLTIASIKNTSAIISFFCGFCLLSYIQRHIPSINMPIIPQARGVGLSKVGFPSITVCEFEMKLMKYAIKAA